MKQKMRERIAALLNNNRALHLFFIVCILIASVPLWFSNSTQSNQTRAPQGFAIMEGSPGLLVSFVGTIPEIQLLWENNPEGRQEREAQPYDQIFANFAANFVDLVVTGEPFAQRIAYTLMLKDKHIGVQEHQGTCISISAIQIDDKQKEGYFAGVVYHKLIVAPFSSQELASEAYEKALATLGTTKPSVKKF